MLVFDYDKARSFGDLDQFKPNRGIGLNHMPCTSTAIIRLEISKSFHLRKVPFATYSDKRRSAETSIIFKFTGR